MDSLLRDPLNRGVVTRTVTFGGKLGQSRHAAGVDRARVETVVYRFV
jgi:hypothetical protein